VDPARAASLSAAAAALCAGADRRGAVEEAIAAGVGYRYVGLNNFVWSAGRSDAIIGHNLVFREANHL